MTLEFNTTEKATDYGRKLIINTELHFGETAFVSMNMARECPNVIRDMSQRNEQAIINSVARAVLTDERGLKWLTDELNTLLHSGYLRSPEYFHLKAIMDRLEEESKS